MAGFDESGEGESAAVFAVGEDGAGLGGGEGVEPIEQFALAGVTGEAAEGGDACADDDVVAEDADIFSAFDEAAAEGAFGLVAGDEDGDAALPEVVFEVVDDSAAFAHAAGGDDDAGVPGVVEGARLGGGGE